MFDPMRPDLLNPPAIVVQADVKDEQTLKREWDEACADEQDAVERKAAVLREALKRWPMVLHSHPPRRAHSPEMRRFVRDVLGMADESNGGMNRYARRLLTLGANGMRVKAREDRAGVRSRASSTKLRTAVIELTTKYRLGADPGECMEALTKYYEELARGA